MLFKKKYKNIGTQHDLDEYDFFDIVLRLDVTLQESDNKYNITRPIYENVDEMLQKCIPSTDFIKEFIEYSEEGIPIY